MAMTFEGHHGTGHRPERVAEEIRHEVSLMLAGELKDPRLAVPLTVTEVRITPDMRTVRVYVQLDAEDQEKAAALEGMKAASGYVRHELIERLRLRRAPEVIFVLDESEKYGEHIDDLLRRTNSPEKA
jgi:ribosome-binding factor A